jgi:hypothetical protein
VLRRLDALDEASSRVRIKLSHNYQTGEDEALQPCRRRQPGVQTGRCGRCPYLPPGSHGRTAHLRPRDV